jgi:signal transduction histidine kinase
VLREDNQVRYVRALNEVVRDRKGKPVSLLGTLQDVTDRRQAEEQLRKSHEELRWLADHLQSARENERISIAREIHDEMAQSLTAQKIDLVRLKSRLPPENAYLEALSGDILRSVNQTIASVQRILTELRPALLDDLGLLAAIEWQVEQFGKRAEIECHIEMPDEEPELTEKERTALFRIMQEALSNVLRHSNATEMRFELNVDNHWLQMSISDNGIGISEIDIQGSKSFGLMGMRERAHIFGGTVNINGKKGEGTTVLTRFPLNNRHGEVI